MKHIRQGSACDATAASRKCFTPCSSIGQLTSTKKNADDLLQHAKQAVRSAYRSDVAEPTMMTLYLRVMFLFCFFIISWTKTQSSSMILRVCPRSAHNLEPRDRISDHREDEGGGYSTHHSHQQASPSVFIYTHTHTHSKESFLLLTRVGRNRIPSN